LTSAGKDLDVVHPLCAAWPLADAYCSFAGLFPDAVLLCRKLRNEPLQGPDLHLFPLEILTQLGGLRSIEKLVT
jgi:hypothetical protein